jgi:hypothetical protein
MIIIRLLECLAFFLSTILLCLEKKKTIRMKFVEIVLWNLLMIYISFYFMFDLHLLYSQPVKTLNKYAIFETVHHVLSFLLSLTSIIHQFYTFELSLCLFLHYFKNIIVYNFFVSYYLSFCVIYNLSYLGIIYQTYKWKKNNNFTINDLLHIIMLILVQFVNNFIHGYYL